MDIKDVYKGNLIETVIKLLTIILYVKGKKYNNRIVDRDPKFMETSILNKIDRLKYQLESSKELETNDLFDILGYIVLRLVQKLQENHVKFREDIQHSIKD
jgi:hypothetical protein